MITFFCPSCWREIKESERTCPHCGAEIARYDNRDFEEKLINALRNPERETVMRAVYILGKRKSGRAIKPLIDLFNGAEGNPFLRIMVLKSLDEMGVPEAVEFIKRTADICKGVVGKEAKRLLEKE